MYPGDGWLSPSLCTEETLLFKDSLNGHSSNLSPLPAYLESSYTMPGRDLANLSEVARVCFLHLVCSLWVTEHIYTPDNSGDEDA